MPESTNKGGRKPRVTDDDLLGVFRETADPVLSTAEVSDALPIKRRGTLNRLRDLEEDGELDSKQIGGRNTVWWPTSSSTVDEGRREPATDTDRKDPVVESGDAVGGTDTPTRPESDDAILAVVERVAEGWDDTTARLGARKAAARAVLEYAREHGTVSKQEAKEDVRPEYPVDGQNDRTWYRKNVRPVLNEAAEYDQSAKAYRLTLGERHT